MSDPREITNSGPPPFDTGIHAELRELARRELSGERREHTLAPTDLVHEAWLRMAPGLADGGAPGLPGDGAPGLSLRLRAARAMRQVLVDHARRRSALKRDAGRRVELDTQAPAGEAREAYLIEVDQVLAELTELAPDLAVVVELRVFGGFTVEETARELGLSSRTVKRRWQLAKGWLHREISAREEP